MTYRNKGLRGFLALLMAALMVLGMCGFGYAADALEDVEVDETILIDEPTDEDDTKADEPDEDDVEVVTQNAEGSRKVTVTMIFMDDVGREITPDEKSDIQVRVTPTDSDPNGNNTYTIVLNKNKHDDDYSWTGSTNVPIGNYKIAGVKWPKPIIANHAFYLFEIEKTTGCVKDNNNVFFDKEDDVSVKVTYTYYKLPTFTLTINKTFEGVDPEDIPADTTIKFKLTPQPSTSNPTMEGLTTVEIPIKYTDGKWTSGPIKISEGKYILSEDTVTISGYKHSGWTLEKMTCNGSVNPQDDEKYVMINGKQPISYVRDYQYEFDIKNNYTKEQSTATQQYTVNYMLVKNGETTQYETVTCDAGADITLMPLPNVNGYTVNGWFEKETSEEIEEGDKENADGNDDAAALNLDEVAQSSLIPDQYGQYAKPGSTIKVDSNRTFYAYAMSSGTPVTYSAYLRINKVDEEGNPVAGAGFTMTNGQTSQGSAGRTDEQGQLLIGMLDVGEFTITETTVPEGYVAGEPVTVSVTSAHTRENPCTVTIVNAKSGAQPTVSPTDAPTGEPTVTPTDAPTGEPTATPTDAPTGEPTVTPTDAPTGEPTVSPADEPTARPTTAPTDAADGEDVPKTGDSGLGNLYALMCLSGLSAIALLLTHRRLRRS